jgi:hypothetical protein
MFLRYPRQAQAHGGVKHSPFLRLYKFQHETRSPGCGPLVLQVELNSAPRRGSYRHHLSYCYCAQETKKGVVVGRSRRAWNTDAAARRLPAPLHKAEFVSRALAVIAIGPFLTDGEFWLWWWEQGGGGIGIGSHAPPINRHAPHAARRRPRQTRSAT